MGRYKDYSYEQTKIIEVCYGNQILPGTFEYTLNKVIDSIDLSIFNDHYHNDITGATAYDPRILLKIVLYAYSKGIIFSRRIAQLCRTNIVFIALSADTHPHFTTIADFVSSMQDEIIGIFRHVLQICMELDLIDCSMFAIDGVKLPSNASKEWSGTKADLLKKKEKLEQALKYMVEQHRQRDKKKDDSEDCERFTHRLERARKKIAKLEQWLENNEDKRSKRGRISQSNVTDNESAKMMTAHGVIQGYNGIAVVDEKHQIVVNAEAFGISQDQGLLKPALEGTKETLQAMGKGKNALKKAVVTADTGFHSVESLEYIEQEKIDGYVPDCNFRKRDPRFVTAVRHKERSDPEKWGKYVFDHSDFTYVKRGDYYRCPAGNRLEHKKADLSANGITYRKYVSKQRLCTVCKLRQQCLTRESHKVRSIFLRSDKGDNYCDRMAAKIDTEEGRKIYSKRMAIVEPVFGNLRWSKGISRFTLRSKRKVNNQWLLYCMVHNIEKILNFGYPKAA